MRLLLLLLPAFALGAEVRLGEVVVTATRTKKPPETVPGSVCVVTRSDMETRGAQTADQALNVLPGVFDRRGKGLMDTSAALTLRGMPDQKRTLVLLDGVPANDAYTGAVAFGGLPVEDLQRIEVVKGPYSSLYGGNAMGGVVNLIPKRPEAREFALRGGYGTGWRQDSAMDNVTRAYASYGDRIQDKLSVFFSAGGRWTDGYPSDFNVQSSKPTGLSGWSETTDNKGQARYLVGEKGANAWKEQNWTLRAWYDFSKASKLSLACVRTGYDYLYGTPRSYLRDAGGAEKWTYGTVKEASFLAGGGGRRQNFLSAKLETEAASTAFELSLGLLDAEKAWFVTPGATAATTRSGGPGKVAHTPAEAYNAELQATFPPVLEKHVLVAGSSFRHAWAHTREYDLSDWRNEDERGSLSYESRGKNRDYALYLQDEITLTQSLSAYLGVRGDWWETFEGFADQPGTAGYPISYGRREAFAFSPKAALVFKPLDKTTLRASGGRAFRAPTVYELYRTWTSGTVVYQANPDLQPESAWSWDAGASQKLWEGSEVQAAFFEHRLKDLVYRQRVSSTLQQYVNAGRARIRGVELEAQQWLLAGARVFANITWNDAKITDNPAKPDTVGKKLVDVPERLAAFGGEAIWGRITASLTGRAVGKRYTDDANADTVSDVYGSRDAYFTADARLSWRVAKNATVSLSLANLTDERYYDYYLAPGRSWFAELALKL